MRENSFKALKKRKNLWRRVLSAALVAALVVGILPTQTKTASAASAKVQLKNLGSLGTVDYGTKKKSGTWWMMNLSGGGSSKYGNRAFCMTLGASCRSGMTYNNDGSDDKEWDSEPSNAKNQVYYYVARWYVLDKNYSKKAYILSQALIWAAEIYGSSVTEDELLSVIKDVKNFSDDLFPNKTAKELYQDIFEPSNMTYNDESYDTWTASTIVYEVTNTSNPSGYQELVMLDATPDKYTPPTEYFPTSLDASARYRQRIIVNKVDEDGEPVTGVDFSLTIDDFDEVYSISVNGSNTSDDFDADATATVSGTTDDNGQIIFQITYELSSSPVWYYTDEDWDKWLEKTAVPQTQVLEARNYLKYTLELEEGVEFWDTSINGYDYYDVSMDGAQALADAERVRNSFCKFRSSMAVVVRLDAPGGFPALVILYTKMQACQ